MHSAPALSYPVERSRFQGWLLGLTGLGGVLTGLLWQAAADPIGWRQGLFAMALPVTFMAAVWSWRHSPHGNLCWDRQTWSWLSGGADPVSGSLAVHLDFQFFLLLSLRSDRGTRIWLWLQRNSDASAWNALRRAVFSRGNAVSCQDARVTAGETQVKS